MTTACPERFVFVVTYGRSGSTLVQNLLNALPGYCIRGENADALGPLSRAWANLAFSENIGSHRRKRLPTAPSEPWFGAEQIDAQDVGQHLARIFVDKVLNPPEGTRVAGFKEIRWPGDDRHFRDAMAFLLRFFPGSLLVFNTRDARDVAKSGWWAEMEPEAVHSRIARWDALFDACQQAHPDRCVRLHYDTYVRDHGAFGPLFDALGEPFDPERVAGVMTRKLTHMKTEEPLC